VTRARPDPTAWRRSSSCESGACVEIASLGQSIAIRNSESPEGPCAHLHALAMGDLCHRREGRRLQRRKRAGSRSALRVQRRDRVPLPPSCTAAEFGGRFQLGQHTWPGPPLRGQLHRASQTLRTRKTAKIVIIVNTAVPMPIHMGGSKVTVQVIPRPIWRRCAAVPGQQLVHLDLMIPTCHRSYCAMAEMRKPTPASAKLARIVP
jgi:hypothetical protein